MSHALNLYFHPLSSFSQKALIAFYETGAPFTPHIVDFASESSIGELKKHWPIGKIPMLRDEAEDRTIPEATIIIEYLAQRFPGRTQLIPADADKARQTRMRDRFYDCYVEVPMQKIVGDRLRPADRKDPFGVEEARALLKTAYGLINGDMTTKTWAMGEEFTLADCAAAPALYYANMVAPFGDTHKNVAAYFARLMARPSFARAVEEAEPYRALFPK